ncbi:hypothetical protein [Streptomyces sp. NPDC088246]
MPRRFAEAVFVGELAGEHPPGARQMAVRLVVLPDDGRRVEPPVDDL